MLADETSLVVDPQAFVGADADLDGLAATAAENRRIHRVAHAAEGDEGVVIRQTPYSTDEPDRVRIADIDGSGTADIVFGDIDR